MLNHYFLILKGKKTKALCLAMIVFAVSAFLFNFSFSEVYADIITPEIPAATSQLLDKSIFRENEQSAVSVHPRFNDNSTNIAFYAECPTVACPDNGTLESPEFVFFAENLGHGFLPFSDYWTPDPSFHKLVAVEYFNDRQQFTCSDLSLNECIADPHFISQFSFEIVDNNAIIPVLTPPTIDIIESGAILDTDFVLAAPRPDSAPAVPTTEPAPFVQENEDGSVTLIIDTIESGAIPDNNSIPAAPLPDLAPVVPAPEPAPFVQENEDGSATFIIDNIKSGAILDTDFIPAAPRPDSAPAVPAPVIQESEDGSITLIAI